MWNLCRTCMSKEREMISIFNLDKSPSINTMIKEISSLTFSPNDSLPSQICDICLETLEKTYFFKKQLISCNNALEKQAQTSKFLALQVQEEINEDDNVYNEHYEHVTVFDSNVISAGNNALIHEVCPSTCSDPLISTDNDTHYPFAEVYCKTPDDDDLPEETSSNYIKCVDSYSEETCIKSEKVEIEEHGVQFNDNCELTQQIVTKQDVDEDGFCTEDDSLLIGLHVSAGNCDKSPDVQENSNENDKVTRMASEGSNSMADVACLSSNKLQKNIPLHAGVAEPKRHKCAHCATSFFSLNNLKIHMRMHTGEMPFKCQHCNKRFGRARALQEHTCLHTGETQPKPHKCELCGKLFEKASYLQKHMVRHSSETKPKPHKCEECGTSFFSQSHLKDHMRIHTGETPFKCQHCDKKFRRAGTLHEHIRLHTGETKPKPYKCEVCGNSFGRPCNLQTHMRMHTGERPFKCQHCDMSFTRKSNLKQHTICMHILKAIT